MFFSEILISLTGKQKKTNFAVRHFQKKYNLTIDLLSLGVYAPGPQVLTCRTPNFAGSSNLYSVPGSGPRRESLKVPVFSEMKAITLRSGVLDKN